MLLNYKQCNVQKEAGFCVFHFRNQHGESLLFEPIIYPLAQGP